MTKYDEVRRWLPDAIARHAGDREHIMCEADRLGYGETMITRAKAELQIKHTPGRDRKWLNKEGE